MLLKLIIRQNIRISIFENLLSFLHFFDFFSDIFQFSLSIFWHNKFLVHCLTFLYFDPVIFWHFHPLLESWNNILTFSRKNPAIWTNKVKRVSKRLKIDQNQSLLISGIYSAILYLSETRQTFSKNEFDLYGSKLALVRWTKRLRFLLFSTI